jgi:hypothetical protein
MRPLANGEPVEAEGAAGGCTSAILGDPSLLSSPLDRGCGETETAVQFSTPSTSRASEACCCRSRGVATTWPATRSTTVAS